jgi:phytoene dehydrogenase-like protein
MPDLLLIGGGHNALVTAFYLAKAGRKPVVLERRPIVGGCAVTEEFAPGYKAPTLAHALGPLRPSIVRDMQLERRGVQFVRPDPRLVSLGADGRALVFSTDVQRTVEAVRPFSAADAGKYPHFRETLIRLGGFLGGLLEMAPPSLNAPSGAELWQLLKAGRRFRALGKKDGFNLLRWGPMAVADLVAEWFESDLLQGSIAARGIFGTAMGPWSAGSAAVLLLAAATDPEPGGSSVSAVGGPGAATHAMAEAAVEAGAEIRTGAAVDRVLIKDGAARGVVLADGTELSASAVISGVDPRRTFLGLIDPMDLDPGFVTRIRNYRVPGTAAKVNVALRGLPAFRGLADTSAALLRGRVIVAPGVDYLERAFDASKYGEISEAPYLDITFPSVADPTIAPSGRHVMSVYMQYAPYRLRDGAAWSESRRALENVVLRTLDEHAPGTSALVEHLQVLTPADFEETFGLSGGHIFHGELSLDQLFTMRPTLGWGQYASPVTNLYLCGTGTHPGHGLTGGSGQNAAREILRHIKQ